MSLLGNRVVRTEDPRFLTGAASYVGDMTPEGCAHVAFVRSPLPHAVMGEIDIAEASAAPGVLGVFTNSDLGDGRLSPRVPTDPATGQPLLAQDRVRYQGEPMVAIVAETVAQALDAAELVFVDLEPLPAVITVDDALAGETIIYPELDTNAVNPLGPLPAAIDFGACEVVVDGVTLNQRIAPAPIEPRVCLTDWSGDRLQMWASCQGAGAFQASLCAHYELEADDVHVIAPDIGGGFGAKGSPSAEELALPAMSKHLGRPVKWAETRSENLTAAVHARGQRQQVRIGGLSDGTITHYSLHVDQECGAYVDIGAMLPMLTMMMTPGTYDIPNVQYTSQAVITNSTPVGAFRGAGRPEAAAAIERAVDLFAAAIEMDPADVRRRNLVEPFSEPHTTPMGTSYDVGDYAGALDRALDAAGYEELRREQHERRANNDPVALGIGLSSYVEITAIGGPEGSTEFGSVELQADGTVIAKTGSTPHGQGHQTSWAMVVADALGIDMDRVTVVFGDTDLIPSQSVTGGSRSAQVAGSAMFDASEKLVEAATRTAARLLEANEDDIVHDRDRGLFHVVGTPAVSVDWAAIAESQEEPLSALSDFLQPASSFPFGAHVSVVEVDTETGKVTLRRHIAVDDCGTIINPLIVDGQVHGGVASGIAQALIEEVVFDDNGTPMTSNFADYGIISAAELPSFERIEMVTPSPLNPLGAKGIGESGTIGSTPAVQNAVIDALGHLGVRHLDMPCTPEKVWQAANP